MAKTLFLYIDILGFSELIKDVKRVERLYRVIDQARLQKDSNFKTIVFSDTILSYNTYSEISDAAKTIELMFLIELTQELFFRLIGSGIYFRAVITEGDFHCNKMEHLTAFFGQALVDTYNAEKKLPAIGLFLDVGLRRFNQVFRRREFSAVFDFVFLTHFSSQLPVHHDGSLKGTAWDDFDFPLPARMALS